MRQTKNLVVEHVNHSFMFTLWITITNVNNLFLVKVTLQSLAFLKHLPSSTSINNNYNNQWITLNTICIFHSQKLVIFSNEKRKHRRLCTNTDIILYSYKLLYYLYFIWPEQAVDGGGPSVDAAQHVACLASQVPAQWQRVQVGKEAYLDYAVGVLLHADPQEGAQVADEAWGTWVMERRVTSEWTDEAQDSHEETNRERELLPPAPPPCRNLSRT